MARTKQAHRERYASGRAKPDTSPVARLRRIWANASKESEVRAMGGVISRLHFVDNYLNQGEAAAAFTYSEAKRGWSMVLGVPFPSPRAQDMSAIKGMGGDIDDRTARKLKSRYEAIYSILTDEDISTLDRHVIMEIWPGWWERPGLKDALAKIAAQTGR